MKGGIVSDQRCPSCGGQFRDNGRDGLTCPEHPEHKASRFKVKFGRGICRRFGSYSDASRFLTGVRYKTDEGTFDSRDYRRDNPLGFRNLGEQWLTVKRAEVRPGSYKNLNNYIGRAMEHWGQRNIREIGYAEIEDFLLGQRLEGSELPVSGKTKANMASCLNSFWTWLRKRRLLALHEMPEFPEVGFELGFRSTIGKEKQEAVIEEIRRISGSINPRVWIGIKWLATYISVRPGELIGIKEKDIDLENGYLVIERPKEKRAKLVPLLEEDVDLVRSLPRGFPEQPFFRHGKGVSGCRPGQPFGGKYLYKWWKKACANLEIDGVDLYGGTRHSSARALRRYRTPEEIKRATMHTTNKAFERYFWIESDDLRDIYRDATGRGEAESKKERAKILPFAKEGEASGKK